MLAKKACGDVGKLSADAEAGIKALAGEFSKGAISFAIGAARRKRAQRLDPGDVALYMKQTWGIDLPGFTGAKVVPYKRLVGGEMHKARLAAVRRGNVALTRQTGAAAGGGAGPSGGGKTKGDASGGKKGGKSTPAAAPSAAAGAAASPSVPAPTAMADEESDIEEDPAARAVTGGGGGVDDDAGDEEDMPDII